MNAKLYILRTALYAMGCVSLALAGVAETLQTIDAAAGETMEVSDVIDGEGDVAVNTGAKSTGTVQLTGATRPTRLRRTIGAG